MERGIDLMVSSLADTQGKTYALAVLPWGATEPHNLHLPYMTDAILSHAVSVDAAVLALKGGVRCMVMPPVTLGAQNPGQREQPFCLHGRYRTQCAILTDVVESLYFQGLRRLIIVNGHGGNSFKNMIRDLAIDYPDFEIACCEWYTQADGGAFFEQTGEHADELETSVMLHYHPELVDLSTAGAGCSKPFAMECLNRKSIWMPRNWAKITSDTGIGDPRSASAQKGARFVAAVTERLSATFIEFATASVYLE